ncbi:unnamed protein product [Heligmosomoides polygyrus]|uniref:Uncharacterized protein n=1 Tax=Heligmosomoides polygyrus TaxID=6339 RepID=A0A3P7TFH7_HELPZ|nr:unnamed protein product [Heligmosomoides polygyrus]
MKELGTISGDDGDAKPKEENDVRFPNGLSITVDDFRNYLRPNSMMCGPLASAMFNHFLPVHKGLRDKGFNFCDPEVFANILSVYKKFPEHELTEEMVARFVNRKGEAREYLKDLLICRFSMIPVCFMDHWWEHYIDLRLLSRPLEFILIFASEHYVISRKQRPWDMLLKISRNGIHDGNQ